MKKLIGIIVLIIVVILLIVFLSPGNSDNDVIDNEVVNTYTPNEIRATHTFSNETHTIVGQIDLPTPCYDLSYDTRIAESMPEQVTIDFKAEVDPDLVCVQVISPTDFTVTFNASEEARISARFNGNPVRLILDIAESIDTEEATTTEELNTIE